MGKKVDKSKEKIITVAATVQDSRSDISVKSHEPYNCTGNFLNDFKELCHCSGLPFIPQVIMRPKIVINEPKPEVKGKGKVMEVEVEQELDLNGEPLEPPPKTFLLKEGLESLKPCVQVELDSAEKYETVTAVYIRGWKIDELMSTILKQCLPLLDKLHTINLWRTGLTVETINSLALILPSCANLKTLILDNNPVKEQNFHVLLSENMPITHLSLRFCQLTDQGAQGIGQSLGTTKKHNTKLISLNLSGNMIGDKGAGYIADGLRTNRCLLVLSLASNSIGDEGATKLSETLSRFALTHEETVERRKLMSTYAGSPERIRLPSISPSSKRTESRDRPLSGRSLLTGKREKQTKKKGDTKGKEVKEDTKAKKEDKTVKKGVNVVTEAATKNVAVKVKDAKKTRKDKSNTPHEADGGDLSDKVIALTEPVDFIDSLLWITGNMVLVSLNLARNLIGLKGHQELLKAIQYQTTITSFSRHSGTGLMRLFIQRNGLPSSDETVMKIAELMLPKDPFYKNPDEEIPPG